jgi:rare lipoprotein A
MYFLKLQHSIIPGFQIIILIAVLFLIGCSGTQRFGKTDSNTGYQKNKEKDSQALEIVEGVASYYSDEYHGRTTANGETYDMYAMTAAHKTYPFNTNVRVTNLANGRSVILRINDRMPDFKGRIIDVSLKAAKELGMIISGIADVELEVLEWGK